MELNAQPVDQDNIRNEQAYLQPFLHCVKDVSHFAKYAVEARPTLFEFTDVIHCKLHIPKGVNKVWADIENSKKYRKGEYNYTNDHWVYLRFNFYLNGEKISTAVTTLERSEGVGPYTYVFSLDPLAESDDMNLLQQAYLELLSKVKKPFSNIAIQVVMPSKNLVTRSYVPIVSGLFTLKADSSKISAWINRPRNDYFQPMVADVEPPPVDYNIRLKSLADSTMKNIFGVTGFKQNFTMSCLKNPCKPGYMFAHSMVTDNPCTTTPQSTCRESVITYSYNKSGVPLSIKMLVSLMDNGPVVYIENNPFGKTEIALQKQFLLSTEEIRAEINEQFPGTRITLLQNEHVLSYSLQRIVSPEANPKNKTNSSAGFRVIEESRAGETWQNGFVYTAFGNDPGKHQRTYIFDAVTGALLWITEPLNVED